jgi:signal transduction histidine kinase/ActR/RegA family two-component response regulator
MLFTGATGASVCTRASADDPWVTRHVTAVGASPPRALSGLLARMIGTGNDAAPGVVAVGEPGCVVRGLRASLSGRGDLIVMLWREEDDDWALADELLLAVVPRIASAYDQLVVQRDRVRLQGELEQAQKLQAVGRLAGGIAHDFNNLLMVITGNLELMRDQLRQQLPGEYIELTEVLGAADRARSLVEHLLAFSHRRPVTQEAVDVRALIVATTALLQRTLGQEISIVCEVAPHDALIVDGDAALMEQTLLNLAVNARDAMPTGGRLSIRTSNISIDAAIGALQAGRHVLIEVQDTGTGMSAEICQQIFEPFFTTKSAGKGTGLGLATVRSIVEQARGDVTVDSTMGLGTTFRVYLPCTDDSADDLASRTPADSMPAGTETILLVEDDDAVRALGQLVLERCGYTVLAAVDGKAALEFAQSYPNTIHLLLSDVVMPHLCGRMLAEAVNRVRPSCKVMFVSGYTDDEVLLHGVVHSEVTMLQKPYSLATLAQTVRRVIDAA